MSYNRKVLHLQYSFIVLKEKKIKQLDKAGLIALTHKPNLNSIPNTRYIYTDFESFVRREKGTSKNSKSHTIFAMNEVIHQRTGHNIEELLLSGMSAEYLLK